MEESETEESETEESETGESETEESEPEVAETEESEQEESEPEESELKEPETKASETEASETEASETEASERESKQGKFKEQESELQKSVPKGFEPGESDQQDSDQQPEESEQQDPDQDSEGKIFGSQPLPTEKKDLNDEQQQTEEVTTIKQQAETQHNGNSIQDVPRVISVAPFKNLTLPNAPNKRSELEVSEDQKLPEPTEADEVAVLKVKSVEKEPLVSSGSSSRESSHSETTFYDFSRHKTEADSTLDFVEPSEYDVTQRIYSIRHQIAEMIPSVIHSNEHYVALHNRGILILAASNFFGSKYSQNHGKCSRPLFSLPGL